MTGASLTSVRPIIQYRLNLDKGIIPYPGMNYTFTDGSTCVCSASTATSCMGLATFENNIVPGFQTGCYMLSALMNSTLEAFYNQTFVDRLTNSSKHIRKLNSSNSDFKVEMLLSQMFVKFWSNTTSYKKYFQSCAPHLCQYTINQRNNLWAVLLLLIGLSGGLSSALRITTPFLIGNIFPIIWKFISRRRAQIATVEDIPVNSICIRLKMLFQLLKRKLIEVNLFPSIPPSQDVAVLRQERHQTRIYLVLLLTGFFILTVFTSIRPSEINITVKLPSARNFIELYEQYSLTLNCPCSQNTLEYNTFISYIKPQYHQICLSELITPRWINLQFIKSPVRVFFINNIQYQSQVHFQFLSTLCRMANKTIEENLQSFYQTKFVSSLVIDPSSFQTQVDLIIDQFKRTVPESYQRTLQLIQANSEINRFIVPLNSEFRSSVDANGHLFYTVKSVYNDERYNYACGADTRCSCIYVSTTECIWRTIIPKPNRFIEIPGMFQTWFPLQSVLMSTLECFYNDTCFSQILQLINPIMSPTNFSTLQLSALSSNDSEYDRIDILANKLFIQSWKNQSSYQSYFNQCHPLTCQYTYQSGLNIIYIVTTVIGLLGGLTIALKLVVPSAVKITPRIWKNIICRKRNNVVSGVETASIKPTFIDRLRRLIAYIKKYLVELNLFPTIPPSQDPNILRRSRRTTRIYLTLLMISLFILAVYTSLTQETVTVILKSPSISTYSELSNQYSLTLQCPCSRIAIKYNKFIPRMEPEYHPICSSVFVSSNWSDAMYQAVLGDHYTSFSGDDFRLYAQIQFETVSKMCTLSQKILNTSLPIWLQTDFITAYVIPRTEFNIQIEGLTKEFKRKTTSQFIQTFKLIQVINHANQLATTQSSNWQFVGNLRQSLDISYDILTILDSNIAQNALQIWTFPQTYGEDHCSCALQSNCSKLSTFPTRTSKQSSKQILPGFRIGCLALDALFQSTFSCLYNQTCLDLMRTAIYYSKPVPAQILIDSSFSSQNITIETYLSQLFLTKWYQNLSFDHYFNECAPQSCEYSYTLKFNRIYFVTTIIALFGGLTSALHFAVSCVSIVVIKLYDRRKRNQVIPDSQQSNNVGFDLNDTTLELPPIPPTTTVAVTMDSIQEQNRSATNHRERAVIICLVLLVIVAITVVSVVWLKSEGTAQVLTSISSVTTSISIIESTTTISNICYMTLVWQSVTYPIGLGGKSLVVEDFNQDSIPDIAVTNYDDGTISVLFGNGDGTFQMQKIYSTGNETYPWGITTADFNNDTYPDLAVTLSTTNQIAIFFGIASNGSFKTVPYTFTRGLDNFNVFKVIAAVDFNNDGFTDLLVGSQYGEWEGFDPFYAVLNLGDGLQYQYNCLQCATVRSIESIVIGDFDNDGRRNDVSVCDLRSEVITLSTIHYPDFDGIVSNAVRNIMYGKPQSIIRGRFNDDELDDLAVVSSQSDTLQVLLAYGDGTFIQQIYSTDSYPTSIARINYNNDSIDDLAVLTCNQTVSIYLGTELGILRRNDISFHIGQNNINQCAHSLKAGDFNQDGKDDLVFIDPEAQCVRIVLGTSCNKHI